MDDSEYKIVRIRWIDAAEYSGWHSADAIDRIIARGGETINTLGYLVGENGNGAWVAKSVGEYKLADVLFIPRGMIIDRWVMGEENE